MNVGSGWFSVGMSRPVPGHVRPVDVYRLGFICIAQWQCAAASCNYIVLIDRGAS